MRRPIILIIVVLVILGSLAAWEFPNYLRKPSLRTHAFEDLGCRIDIFYDGVRPREAAVFFKGSGREVLLDVFSDDGVSLTGSAFGSLRWTRDRTALVATELKDGEIESNEALWVFDTARLLPVPAFEREDVIRRKGGLGEPVFSWFDFGRPGKYLFSWQADQWRAQVKTLMDAGG